MNRWKDAFEKHPIHETLLWLADAASSNMENLSEREVSEQRRLKKVISKYRSVLDVVDPEIVSTNQLDSLNTQLRHQNVTNQVNAYKQNGSVGQLVAINDLVSKQLTQLSIFQAVSGEPESQDKLSYIDSVIDSTINGLSVKKESLEAQLNNITSEAEGQASKLDTISEELEQKKAELSQLSSEWQNQFSSAQDSRSQEFSKWRDVFASDKNKEVQELIDEYTESLDTHEKNFKAELDRVIKDSKSKHQSILDLYELTAGDSVGAAYIKSANDENVQANRWRNVSVGFISATVAWLIFSFFYDVGTGSKALSTPENVGFPWHAMLIAFSISGVLMWGAAYSAQQSTKHRNSEKRARWFALEVKAFDPFISSLEESQQNELKKQLAERLFGQNSSSDEDAKVVDEHALKVVTDAFGQVLSKVPKN